MVVVKLGASAFFIVMGLCALIIEKDNTMALAMFAFSVASMASAQADTLHRRVSELEHKNNTLRWRVQDLELHNKG